jgi:hypothetical protein
LPRLYRTPLDREIQAARRRVNAKIRRYRDKDIDFSYSHPDLSTLSGSAKRAELRKLNEFAARRVLRGAGNTAHDKQAVTTFNRLQDKVNKQNKSFVDKHAAFEFEPGRTVGGLFDSRYMSQYAKLSVRQAKTHPNEFGPIDYTPENMRPEGLSRMRKHLENKLKGKNLARIRATKLRNLEGMVAVTGDEELLKSVRGLNAKQRDVLIHLTTFMDNVALDYEQFQSDNGLATTSEIQRKSAHEIVNRVKKYKI